MKKMLATGLLGLALSFGALTAGPALAEEGAGSSVEKTTVVDLVAHPATKAVVDKHIPQLASHPAYDQFKDMTLKQLQPMSQGAITDDILTAVQADLDKIPADEKK